MSPFNFVFVTEIIQKPIHPPALPPAGEAPGPGACDRRVRGLSRVGSAHALRALARWTFTPRFLRSFSKRPSRVCQKWPQRSVLRAARKEPPPSPGAQEFGTPGPRGVSQEPGAGCGGAACAHGGPASTAACSRGFCPEGGMTQLLPTWASRKRPACHRTELPSRAAAPEDWAGRPRPSSCTSKALGSHSPCVPSPLRLPGQPQRCERPDHPSPQASFTSNNFKATHL